MNERDEWLSIKQHENGVWEIAQKQDPCRIIA